jgi:hypothetical protein
MPSKGEPVPVRRVVVAAVVVIALAVGGIFGVQWWRERLPKVYDLDPACAGKAYQRAAPFAGKGPHPVAIFQESEYGHLEKEEVYEKNGPAWPPSDPEHSGEVQLVACATVVRETPSEAHCSFGLGGSVTLAMYDAAYEIRVSELRTHHEVGRTTVEATDDECPPSVTADSPPDRLLTDLTFDEWQKALGALVTKDR